MIAIEWKNEKKKLLVFILSPKTWFDTKIFLFKFIVDKKRFFKNVFFHVQLREKKVIEAANWIWKLKSWVGGYLYSDGK